MILATICVLEIIAIVVAVTSEPVYRSAIVIMKADTQEQRGILGSLASGFGGFAGALSEELAIEVS